MPLLQCSTCSQQFSVDDSQMVGVCPRCRQPIPLRREDQAERIQPNLVRSHAEAETLPPQTPIDPAASLPHTMARLPPPAGVPAEYYDFLAPAEASDELGRLGPYRVLGVLGTGGMGVVFQAEDPSLQRVVALKALLPTLAISPSARQRFMREARAAAALDDDHIVHIYQVGEDRGIPYMAMQLLKGEPLEARLKGEPVLPVAEVLRIGREIAEGLAVAHAHGLIHRDIKPANIWLEAPPLHTRHANARVKILDFGLARAAVGDVHLTQSGAILGTPAYMAPEQGKMADQRTDLFSLGCVLYRMATGQPAFHTSDAVTTLIAVATQNPPAPREVNANVPVDLDRLIMQLLAKEPDQRPQSAAVVVDQIRAIENQERRPDISATAAHLLGGLLKLTARVRELPWKKMLTREEPDVPSTSRRFVVPQVYRNGWRRRGWRWRPLRIAVIVILFLLVCRMIVPKAGGPVVIQHDDSKGSVTVRLGDKKLFEVRGEDVPKEARQAAEIYLKKQYASKWSISSAESIDDDHVVFKGTVRSGTSHPHFRLVMKENPDSEKWEVENIVTSK
jgi:serine/threonine protein kinase